MRKFLFMVFAICFSFAFTQTTNVQPIQMINTPILENEKLLFASNRDGNYEIYMMDIDGKNQERLTFSKGLDFFPVWSPNYKQILFYTSIRQTSGEILKVLNILDIETKITKIIEFPIHFQEVSDARWSPDGKQIVFKCLFEAGNYEICKANSDGTQVSRLTHSPGLDSTPMWSPNGLKIAFHSDRDGNAEIYLMNADGSNQENISKSSRSDFRASWSPDGSKIAFHSYRDGNYEIYMMNIDGSSQKRLTFSIANDFGASWSPDSSKIAFSSEADEVAEIHMLDLTTQQVVQLTNNSFKNVVTSWGKIQY